MTTLSAAEILSKHGIAYIATTKDNYTTKCPDCDGGYCDVKIDGDGVQWYCHHCEHGGGEFFDQRQKKKSGGLSEPTAIWNYYDENRKRLFQTLRFEPPGQPKKFLQRKSPEQEKWSVKGVRMVVYRLPELREAIDNEQVVFLPEGEKCADSLVARGLIATTNPGGAGTPAEPGCRWRSEFNESFRDADVVLIPDNDAIGRKHMRVVATNLLPVVRCLRILDLRGIWPDIEQSDDIFDWFERSGGTADRLLNIIGDLEPLSEVPGESGNGTVPTWLDDADPAPLSNGHDADPRTAPRFTLKRFNEIKLATTATYLIKGLLPRSGLAVVWGPPKCGKSFIAFDAAMHIATGREYRGRRVQQGTVVYCALEGGGGFAARVEAWRKRKLGDDQSDDIPFYLLDVALDLIADQDELVACIRIQVAQPNVVFIDTLNRALIGDENSSADMGKLVRAAAAISAAFDCLVVLIHHCGIAGNRPRGHSSLSGADDAQIAVSRDKTGRITVTIEHMKDSETTSPYGCRLEQVDLGRDDDGDPITSCVVVPEALPDAKKPDKLQGNTKLAYDSLAAVLAKHGQPSVPNEYVPPDIRVCSAILWREHFYNTYSGKPDTKQKAFVRTSIKLQELKIIGIWGDQVWLPDNPDIPGQT